MVTLKNQNGDFFFADGTAAEVIFYIELMRDKGDRLVAIEKIFSSDKYPEFKFDGREQITVAFDGEWMLILEKGMISGRSAYFLKEVVVPFLELLNKNADQIPWKFLREVYGFKEDDND